MPALRRTLDGTSNPVLLLTTTARFHAYPIGGSSGGPLPLGAFRETILALGLALA
jgi:hypothetical protein